MTNEGRPLGKSMISLAVGVLAAVIAVRGTISIVPDFILRNRYGDIHGLFQLGLAVMAIVVAGQVGMWVDRQQGINDL